MRLFFRKSKKVNFIPDFKLTEYDNWLDFLEQGGISEEWDALKKKNGWKFKPNAEAQFEKEFRPAFRKYLTGTQKIKDEWSIIYNSKTYIGGRADHFEQQCLQNIDDYKIVHAIEKKYHKDHMTSVEGYKRLCMLYEKQKRYDKAVAVCKDALKLSKFPDMQSRLEKISKKLSQ